MDRWVLSTVELGYSLQFISTPSSHPPFTSIARDPFHEELLVWEVQSLFQMGTMEEVPQNLRRKGFYSHYFIISKAKGDLRLTLDLRQLNN